MIVLSFSKRTYSVSEGDGSVQAVLILNKNPLLIDTVVEVFTTDGLAIGEI